MFTGTMGFRTAAVHRIGKWKLGPAPHGHHPHTRGDRPMAQPGIESGGILCTMERYLWRLEVSSEIVSALGRPEGWAGQTSACAFRSLHHPLHRTARVSDQSTPALVIEVDRTRFTKLPVRHTPG